MLLIQFGQVGGARRGDALPDKPGCGETRYIEVVDAAEAHVGEVLLDDGDVVCAIEFLVDKLAKWVCGRAQRAIGAL